MNDNNAINRRNFVKLAAGSLAAIPVLVLSTGVAADDMPKLTEDDATAAALGYKHNSADVDGAKYANHSASQLCSNCALYQAEEGSEWGPCAIFPGKLVAADGWCTAYAAKPA